LAAPRFVVRSNTSNPHGPRPRLGAVGRRSTGVDGSDTGRITGCVDAIELGGYLRPTLTTVKTAPAEIGAEAARLLLDVIDGLDVSDVDVAAATLLLRESTGPAPEAKGRTTDKTPATTPGSLKSKRPSTGRPRPLTLAFAALASLKEGFLSECTPEPSTTQYVVRLGRR
jgi:substrate-binding family protein